jgi:hypothetical protein
MKTVNLRKVLMGKGFQTHAILLRAASAGTSEERIQMRDLGAGPACVAQFSFELRIRLFITSPLVDRCPFP